MSQNGMTPLTNPITEVGRVVYNARRDGFDLRKRRRGKVGQAVYTQGPASKGNDARDLYSIQKHDLLLMNRDPKKRRVGMTNDTDIHVFASANHVRVDDPISTSERRTPVERLRDQLTFGGIASNYARYDETNTHNEEGFATQFGGLTTIVNTGDVDINAGDFVMWDLPDPSKTSANRWKHAPKSKALFITKPYTYQTPVPELDTLPAGASDEEKFTVFRRAHFANSRRCIGRAMSSAKPQQQFDILLGNYCA